MLSTIFTQHHNTSRFGIALFNERGILGRTTMDTLSCLDSSTVDNLAHTFASAYFTLLLHP